MQREEKSNYREQQKEEDHLDPTTDTINRLGELHLGSGGSDPHHHNNNDNYHGGGGGHRVIFSDPCSMCGTMKRRFCYSSSPFQLPQESIFINNELSSPRNHKRKKIFTAAAVFGPEEKDGAITPSPFPSLGRSFFPISFSSGSITPSPPPPAEATTHSHSQIQEHQPNYTFLLSSISKPITTPTSTPTTVAPSPSPSPIKSPPRPQTSPEANLASISTTPHSQENVTALKQSTTTNTTPPLEKPVPVVVVSYLKKYPSFPGGSCHHHHHHQDSETTAAGEGSPSAPSFPPLHPHLLLRSFSDPNPHSSSSIAIETTSTSTKTATTPILTTSSAQIIGDQMGTPFNSKPTGDNPSVANKRWRRMKDSLTELKQKLNKLIEEHNQHHSDEDDEEEEDKVVNEEKIEIDIQKQEAAAAAAEPAAAAPEEENVMEVEEVVMAEEKVRFERDGEGMKVQYKCSCCGIPYKVHLAMKKA